MQLKIVCECGNEEEVKGFGEVYDGFDLKKFSITSDEVGEVIVQCKKCYKDTIIY